MEWSDAVHEFGVDEKTRDYILALGERFSAESMGDTLRKALILATMAFENADKHNRVCLSPGDGSRPPTIISLTE